MKSTTNFTHDMHTAISTAKRTTNSIPLIGLADTNTKEAQVAALISVLADMIESTCVRSSAMPTTHASAA